MSHQSYYEGTNITNLDMLRKSMDTLGFKESVINEDHVAFHHSDSWDVNATKKKTENGEYWALSSDFHLGTRSETMSNLVGGKDFENVMSLYNAYTIAETFTEQGCIVTVEQMEPAKVQVVVEGL